MSNSYTKLTITPSIPNDLLCGLEGHLLMSMLGNEKDDNNRRYFYSDESIDDMILVDDDLVALVEAAPVGGVADGLRKLDLENKLGDDLYLSEQSIDYVDLLAALVNANPEKLPRLVVQGCFTGDRCRPDEHGGFAHVITPGEVQSIDTQQWIGRLVQPTTPQVGVTFEVNGNADGKTFSGRTTAAEAVSNWIRAIPGHEVGTDYRVSIELLGEEFAANIDYLATARSYGFRITTREDFKAAPDRPEGLLERAANYPGSHVFWDPDDGEDGFLLCGNDPEELAKDWVDGRPDEVKLTYKTEA